MDDSPPSTLTPTVEPNGFTLVEEDDVAFTLTLCREINRIYGGYQDGDLTPSENVWAGLNLTLKMVASLQGIVVDGMPAMRLRVAAAQAREMNAVLFGEVPSAGKLTAPSHVMAAPTGDGVAFPGAGALGPGSPPTEPPVRQEAGTYRPGRRSRDWWAALWARQPVVVKTLIGLLACVAVAALINVPLALIALFPDLLVPMAGALVVVSATVALLRHHRASAADRHVMHPVG